MQLWKIEPGKPAGPLAADEQIPMPGFAWLDIAHEEMDLLQAEVQRLTGVRIVEVHLADAGHLGHPSSFDSTDTYEIVVFRGLDPASTADAVLTRPMTLFNFDRLLVTVRAVDSRSVAQVRARFANLPARNPQCPDDLMHRLLSAMVDHYLALRQPLAKRLDDWQHAPLDPRKPFRDWAKLLGSRQQIRELQNLCEEQRDAIQEWRDYRGADLSSSMQAHFADIVEHVERVLQHARTIESQAESAVQLYFAATSHRTTEIMRLLTLITAVFMPLTLVTGLFGMNFEIMPWLHRRDGFWLSIGTMCGIVVGMIVYFRYKRWI